MEEGEVGRVMWRSRRGLLELDLRLVPFARDAYSGLDAQTRRAYCELLEEDDPDVLAWLTGLEPVPPRFASIVALVTAYRHG